ncbi:Imm21 family immunity protein [Streptomyces sp. NRRL S-378]|uniref:Imm21 family immunity protein n=1 Tax=Streptomyces sp. NRRL S-378 TaxID=1463904 RepID=UPI00099D3366|nr:Imm21 family immunity protein [Streptomyces sp. NRRL S-378]
MGANVDEHGRPWTNSGGGPVIVVPAEAAEHWRGTLPPVGAEVPEEWTWGGANGPECDYDRACGPPVFEGTPYGGFGWVEVQGKPALILDGEIVTRFEGDSEGGVLVRNPISEARADLEKTLADGWRSVGVDSLSLTDGRLFMFDSAFEGAADPAQISADNGVGVITLGAGRWRVDFATTVDEVDLVRFRRV